MTDDVQVANVDQAPVVNTVEPQVDVANESTDKVEQPVSEKMIPQSQVNRIAAREARHAEEKTRAKLQADFERQKAEWGAGGAQQQPSNQPNSFGGVQQQSSDEIRKLIWEEAQKMSLRAMGERIETEFHSKINAAKDSDPEFADLYEALNIENYPEMVFWLNGLDNTASVTKDIAKNPSKFSNILMLARSGSPRLAEMELRKLSSSIKANEDALKQKLADEPLSQIKSSGIGTDNGELNISDYRKQSWLRG